jgi:autotransporter-associated beta strand protein
MIQVLTGSCRAAENGGFHRGEFPGGHATKTVGIQGHVTAAAWQRQRGLAAAVAILAMLATPAAKAADIVKADNTTNLNSTGSWVGGVVPGSSDVAVWNSTVTGANSVALGAGTHWSGMRIENPGGSVSIQGESSMKLGSSGLVTQIGSPALDFLDSDSGFTLSATQQWSVNSSVTVWRTLAVSAGTWTVSGSGLVTHRRPASGSGNLVLDNGNLETTTATTSTRSGSTTLRGTQGSNFWFGNPNVTYIGSALIVENGAVGSTDTKARTIAAPTTLKGTLQIAGTPLGDFAKAFSTGGIDFSNTVDLDGGNAANRSINTFRPSTISGVISNGGFTKGGTDTLTLSAANTFAGPLVVAQGTLVLASTGSFANAETVTVASGATLNLTSKASGFAFGAGQTLGGSGLVSMEAGQTLELEGGLAPGSGMSINGNVFLDDAATTTMTISGTATGQYSTLSQAGGSRDIFYAGILSLAFTPGWSTEFENLKLFDFATRQNNFIQVQATGLAPGYTASFDALTGSISVVPEPTSLAAAGLALLAAVGLWRRGRLRGSLAG